MLRISLIEFILRTIPEAFLIVLAIYILNYKRIDPKMYIASSIFIAISTYLVRLLPINYGVHATINIISYILIVAWINRINIIKATSSVLKVMITISTCEWINVAMLDKVMKLDLKMIFNDPLKKVLYSEPSMVMFSIIILLFYKFQFKTRIRGIQYL
ncbi:hypothetical protein G9F73_015570 [Clostridium estertheticum]|uniref:hypothetical protein n=1 Tax=Clostridium estertheticum TaxID=238834 RepID=UPI0013EE6C7F|nr:hypothetical protein [Clostridium estertheticum]MBZ9609209.1 hypothetical protein [Clostridium estertheticum]